MGSLKFDGRIRISPARSAAASSPRTRTNRTGCPQWGPSMARSTDSSTTTSGVTRGGAPSPVRVRGQQLGPRVRGDWVKQRGELGAGGGAEPGGASGDAQPAAVVEPAEDQLPTGFDRADHAADDGLGGDPGAELVPARTPGR